MNKGLINKKFKYTITVSIIITILLTALCIRLHIFSSFSPVAYSSVANAADCYNNSNYYVKCYAEKLYYTGYDYMQANKVKAHYYYSLKDNNCTIYMLSTELIERYISDNRLDNETPYVIENFTFNAILDNKPKELKPLLKYIATDLNWNYEGISKYSNTILVNEYSYNTVTYVILIIVTGIFILISSILIFIYLGNHLLKHKKKNADG